MMPTNSPEGWSFNGEPASGEEIDFMEALAKDLLLDLPAEYHRQYGYATEDGSIAMFSTHISEEEAELRSLASVEIASGSPDNIKLEITFDYDNNPSHIFFTSTDDLGEITSIIQDLLEADGVQPIDANVLRHLQSIVFCMMNAISPKHIAILPETDPAKDDSYVGDVVRSQVENNTTCTVRTKVWCLPLDDNHTLTVSSSEIIGEVSENDDAQNLPILQIEYEDRSKKTTYTYSRQQNGETVLDTTVGDEAEDNGQVIDDDLEDMITLLLEDITNNSTPAKQDVGLLINALSQAILIEF
jgi:hypothetical protein